MQLHTVKQDLLHWIEHFVEVPRPELEGWAPCPYARQARLLDKIDIRLGVDPCVDLMRVTMERYDVIAYVYQRHAFSSGNFNDLVLKVNQGFLLPKNMIALADHPDDQEIVNGVCMNQGHYAIAFVQDLTKLNQFARQLAQKKFYATWSESYLKVLFQGREDPRKT